VCVFITAGPSTKLLAWGGDMGGHALRETTSLGLCGERVLFIGTQFSILYTSMYSPAEAATPRA
jgi:hypothetical protein